MDNTPMISYLAYESSVTRIHHIIHKLIVTLVVSVILLFTSNMVWLYVWVNNANRDVINTNVVSTEMSHTESKASNEAIDQERKRQTIKVKKSKIEWDNLSRTEVEELIDEWIFSERDRKIMKRRLLDGICYEPLAEEFDLSVSQIKNIVRRCLSRLFV